MHEMYARMWIYIPNDVQREAGPCIARMSSDSSCVTGARWASLDGGRILIYACVFVALI